jgi:hypothetical protein
MHGMSHVKVINAQQAKLINNYKNIKVKLHLPYASIRSDAYGKCSLWYPADDGGLTTETCRGDID